jgi:putative hemolysin
MGWFVFAAGTARIAAKIRGAFRSEIIMAQTRRVRFRFRIGGRRWAFPFPRRHPRFGRRNPLLQQETASPAVHDAQARTSSVSTWPLLATTGSLEVRIAATEDEIVEAQRLRYRVFYEEMSAIPTPQMRAERRDFDRYDEFCDHLLVVDRNLAGPNGKGAVVGTYRLLRGEVAALHGGYYTATEYDLSTMVHANPPGTRFLELGRSCTLKSYRARPITMQSLWRGIILYNDRYNIDVMFGCGSFPGTDPDALALQLSYLHHYHRAPESCRLRARPELFIDMNRMPKDAIDPKDALRKLPPLIKGYVRSGSYIGDGAVIDRPFGTTDVLIYFPVARLDKRWRSRYLHSDP